MQRRLIGIVLGGVVMLAAAGVLSATQSRSGELQQWLLLGAALAWSAAVIASWRSIGLYLARRSTRYGLNAFVLSFLVLVILMLLGFIADRHAWRRDVSASGDFTLSEKTIKVLQGVSKPIDIYAYYEPSARQAVRDLLTEYTRRSRRLTLHIEDLNKDPELAERYGVSELGTLVFDAGDKYVRLKTFGEEDVTNALIKVSRSGSKRLYFVASHGEKDVADKGISGYAVAAAALQRENYEPLPLTLASAGHVPEDCDVLVVAGPKSGYVEQELQAIQRYLQTGGRGLFLFDPRFESGLEGMMARWGIQVGNDRVVDPSPTGQLMGRDATTPLVNRYGVHPITKQFTQLTYYQSVRSVRKLALYRGTAETWALAFSGDQSWGETDLLSRQVSFDVDDLPGPISIAMASRFDTEGMHPEVNPEVDFDPRAERRAETALEDAGQVRQTGARIVVFGDSDFAANKTFNDLGNGNLFLNAIAWLAEDEDLIAIRDKPPDQRSISLTPAQIRTLNIFSIAVLPGLVAAAGCVATLRRRARG